MPRPLKSLDERMLAKYMSDLSEDRWRAGWLSGLEFDLWAAMQEETATESFRLTEQEKADLVEFHVRTGGWVVWDDEQAFVTDKEWKERLSLTRSF